MGNNLEFFTQVMYGEYACSCGCGQPLVGKCMIIGEADDMDGDRWRIFTQRCWESNRLQYKAMADVYRTYPEAPLV